MRPQQNAKRKQIITNRRQYHNGKRKCEKISSELSGEYDKFRLNIISNNISTPLRNNYTGNRSENSSSIVKLPFNTFHFHPGESNVILKTVSNGNNEKKNGTEDTKLHKFTTENFCARSDGNIFAVRDVTGDGDCLYSALLQCTALMKRFKNVMGIRRYLL